MAYLKEIYAEMAEKRRATEDFFEKESRLMLVEKLLRQLPPGKFCDVGCGPGLLLNRMKDRHECYGADYDPGAVEYCRSLKLSAEQIDLNEATELPFPGVNFDIVVISEVMEHLLDPTNALRVIKRSLKPGGTLIVTVPNSVPLCSRLKVLFGRTDPWLHYPSEPTIKTGHIRFYTQGSMSRLLREEGFDVELVHGSLFRWNGKFWARLCYWLPRLFSRPWSEAASTRMDLWLGGKFPGLSPDLLFLCRKSGKSST